MKKFLILLFFIPLSIVAQIVTNNNIYPFIHYDDNKFEFPNGNFGNFEKLFSKFDTLLLYGTGQITVVQIGASHTQADIFTGRLRDRLQNVYPGLSAGRGYVFPYNLIRTNSPKNYKAYHTGQWHVCRNIDKRHCTLGVTGISATTSSPSSSIAIKLTDTNEAYSFTIVKIFHSTDSLSFIPQLTQNCDSIVRDSINGITTFFLSKPTNSLKLTLKKTNIHQNYFRLYGIFLENTYPGIVFHAIGVNGASTKSYNKCQLFVPQLKQLSPDWVIVALGTNDGYTYKFYEDVFKKNMEQLIKNIKLATPNAAITIIVPNDDYYKRRYPNPNTAKQEKIIKKVAQEQNCAVWDMYKIMGGYNSSVLWLKYGLMRYDKIHFTHEGYTILADLFFIAFNNAYQDFIMQQNNKLKR